MGFKDPWVLMLIVVVVPAFWFILARKQCPAVRFPSTILTQGLPKTSKVFFSQNIFLLRVMAAAFFVVALAGPRKVLQDTQHASEGIDIVLAIDSSGSMAAEDFTINGQRFNRLEVVKKVVEEFIQKRTADRIGLVTFAGLAYTVCPLTSDYNWLTENLSRIQLGMIEDGTAVGSAVVSGLSRLKDSKAQSKIIILLTDGVSNAGKVDPLTAAKTAQAMGVKVYTIGVGTRGVAPVPIRDRFGRVELQQMKVEIDENLLQEIASTTGGQYYRATDRKELEEIYRHIDELEKTKIDVHEYTRYEELFAWFLIPGVILFFLEFLMAGTRFRTIP